MNSHNSNDKLCQPWAFRENPSKGGDSDSKFPFTSTREKVLDYKEEEYL